jgi:hypothetical protein
MFEVQTTKDYSKFKFIAQNRQTSSTHISKLVESIKKKNLTKDFPIIVNDRMEILDGQNRFEALKALNLPVNYRLSVEMSTDDISLINSMFKKWSLEDFLHQYISQGMESYVKLREFMSWSNVDSVMLALKIIRNIGATTNKGGGPGVGGENSNSFKIGRFLYPKDDSIARKTVLRLKELSQFLKKKNPYDRSLIVAYDCIIRTEGFDYDRLVSKLQNYPVEVYNDANTLIIAFENAYNYNAPHNKKILFRRAK